MAYRTTDLDAAPMPATRAPNIVRWGAVWTGALIGVGCMAILSALWFALGYASNVTFISNNMQWWLAGTGIFSFFLGGLLGGLVSGVRGILAGMLTSATMWALATTFGVVVCLVIAGGKLDAANSFSGLADQIPDNAWWATFAAMGAGLLASILGGMFGGLTHRSVVYPPVVDRDADTAYPDDRTSVLPGGYDERAYNGRTDTTTAGRHRETD